ncbi:hypothetical protein [Haladaptatus halobius]|uniref:hypothetical protein n=1 Tax=Haladaptatus halobius TaxID=2884875 RepID=UPI001D0A95EA|nr:hypothetical protein [Haladaptatus halobius]
MVLLDRRDEFAESESDFETIAATAHELYHSDEFHDAFVRAIRSVLTDHIDTDKIDDAADAVLAEWLWRDGKGGLFQLRNQIVSNEQADLAECDIIYMASAVDANRVIPFVVKSAVPEKTGVSVWRVDPDDGEISGREHSAGHVLFCDRFSVDRSRRNTRENPYLIVEELAETITEDSEKGETE